MLRLRRFWLDPDEASVLLTRLLDDVDWRSERLRLYGREVDVPRLVAWFGDPGVNYRYSAADHPCTGWLPDLDRLRQRLLAEEGLHCNLVLLNRYRHGLDYMGWHTDAERGLESRIASVSLGAARRFLLRLPDDPRAPAADCRPSRAMDLDHGSLLLMDGRVPHSLPRTRRPVGQRINLTFRCIRPAGA